MIEVHCHCGHFFSAPDSLAGGIANCPSCGKAVEVSGLRDPFWRVLVAGAVVLWVGVTAAVGVAAGPAAAVLTGLTLAGVLWLISRAL